MRTKLISANGPSHSEWMIVSRFGTHGECLSIGWTAVPVDPGDAPLQLTPRQTAFAMREGKSCAWTPATFRLLPSPPNQLTVAGVFLPAEGYVRLYDSGSTLRMRSEGKCLNPDLRSAWNLEATRAPWVGEFIEQKTAR